MTQTGAKLFGLTVFAADVRNATYLTHAAGPGSKFDVGFRVVKAVE
jgi:class 3 adenylate cyclase